VCVCVCVCVCLGDVNEKMRKGRLTGGVVKTVYLCVCVCVYGREEERKGE